MNNITSRELAQEMAYAENAVRSDPRLLVEQPLDQVIEQAELAGIWAGMKYTRALSEQIASVEMDVSGPRYANENDFVTFERTHGFNKGVGRNIWCILKRENQSKPSNLGVRYVSLLPLPAHGVAVYALDVLSLENALHDITVRSAPGKGNIFLYEPLFGRGGGPISHSFVKQLYEERQLAHEAALSGEKD